MVKRFSAVAPVLTLAVAAALALPMAAAHAAQRSNSPDSSGPKAKEDPGYALVVLGGEPLATYVKTKPPKGKKIDFDQSSVKSYRAQLSKLRNDYKAWLRANVPQASVTGEFDISLNAVAVKLGGASLAQVAASPLVRQAQLQGLYYPTAADPDLAIIKAVDAWNQSGGAANAGAGVKVAIVDSGIDHKHPCFDDTPYGAQTQLGDKRFTNNKVIVAKVFNNKTPSRNYTAEAIDSHGTHVAGTVACNFETPTVVDGVTLPYKMSGVAPRALLGNYNIFPADVANARSEDILNALEAAYQDGFDVANMSLGGGASGIQDLLTHAIDNLDRAGMVLAVAAGNEGPGYRTMASPGSAARALTAGASSVGHAIVHQLDVGGTLFPGVKGEFGAGPVTAPLAVLLDAASPFNGLSLACNSLAPLNGAIALISRGDCDFSVKMRNVQAAGGAGAIVVNREPGAFVMGQNGDGLPQPTIPGFMVDQAFASALKAKGGLATTLPQLGTYEFAAAGNDVIADFTNWGPTDVDFRIKPDVMAPGVNIVSSIPRSFCGANATTCFAFFNGTSMATPHLAGSAAVLRAAKPDWSAAEIRSAIVNTADRSVVRDLNGVTVLVDANKVGTGRENLLSALNAQVALDPVSLSFGAVPSGSGQSAAQTLVLTNTTAASKTYVLATVQHSASDVAFGVSPSTVTVAAGASAEVRITMAAQRGAAAGHKQAVLQIGSGGGVVANAMLYTLIK